ncbi:MAG: hypothetical protein DRR42_14055 [Gammaproteobacteria bacterium]|nr:MAG: hypothetical protein DRR42_14055 [Gammaproteobacteria bacterium]
MAGDYNEYYSLWANIVMWLVVHTPKTAGTSLRWALEKYFGKSNIIRDYGPHSKVTGDVVREHLYSGDESKGPETLVTEISGENRKILIGHFPLQRYSGFFETQNIIAFVRDPLVRMCSEYLHRVKNKSFTGSFLDFLQRPAYQNFQSRFLDGVSEDTFIGITEKYPESLQHINRIAHWALSARKKNVGRRGGGQKFAENLSVHELDLFYKMNADDVELYQFATRRFAALEN